MKRKFSFKYLMLIPSIAILLSSCSSSIAPDVYHQEFNIDRVGTDYSESVYRFKEPITVLELMNQNDSMRVYVYKKIDWDKQGGIFGLGSNYQYDLCAAAFKNNKLLYWGYLDDFKKEQDPLIQMLGEKATEKVLEGMK